MTYCSTNLALVLNLRNTADDHKKYCGHNCAVSLSQLREAAIIIGQDVWKEEQDEVKKLIKDWPF